MLRFDTKCIYKGALVPLIESKSGYFVAVEDSYSGPKIEDGKITEEFVISLMEYYKAQKVLHRKYAFKVRHKCIQYSWCSVQKS